MVHVRLKEILGNKPLSEEAKAALDTLRNPLQETQEVLANAYEVLEEMEEIRDIVSEVYTKPGTDMGDFWISFLEMTDALAQNIHACHTQSYAEFKSSTYEMMAGMRAYNNTEYARYLPDFWAMLENLTEEQAEFFESHFVQSMSGLPYSALDMWIEVTMNMGSKRKEG